MANGVASAKSIIGAPPTSISFRVFRKSIANFSSDSQVPKQAGRILRCSNAGKQPHEPRSVVRGWRGQRAVTTTRSTKCFCTIRSCSTRCVCRSPIRCWARCSWSSSVDRTENWRQPCAISRKLWPRTIPAARTCSKTSPPRS
jgi:hypothetical protein